MLNFLHVDAKMKQEQFSSASILVRMADLCRLFFVHGEPPVLEPDVESDDQSEHGSDDDEDDGDQF